MPAMPTLPVHHPWAAAHSITSYTFRADAEPMKTSSPPEWEVPAASTTTSAYP